MRVLQVNDADLRGRNFSGYDLLTDLAPYGIEGRQAVLTKKSDDLRVFSLWSGPDDERLHHAVWRVELRHSMNGLLFPWGEVLKNHREFQNADVVHYHLPHNQMISLFDLEMLTSLKPSVWTFHDSWPMTGHCVQPVDCLSWLDGCDPCLFLNAGFILEEDRASAMWRIKKRVFEGLDIDVIVASEFMRDAVRRSPITAHLDRVHHIPFGIKVDSFNRETKAEARKALGIEPDDFVVFFRSSPQELKGAAFAFEALAQSAPARPTTVLTVDQTGVLGQLEPDYRVVELGWMEDLTTYARAFSACDVFLMPSLVEGFGLMALEAMASSRPVICFEGTSVASIVQAPDIGIAVPMRDASAIRAVIDDLAADPVQTQKRGEAGRQLVGQRYRHEMYLESLAELYQSLACGTDKGV